jgi:hypothetical protein
MAEEDLPDEEDDEDSPDDETEEDGEDLPDDDDSADDDSSAGDDDFPDDFPDDFDFDEDEDEDGGGDKKRWIIIGASAFAGLLLLAGGGYLLFSGDSGEAPKSNIPVVSLDLPPKAGRGGGRSLNAMARNPGAAGKPARGGLNALSRNPNAGKRRIMGKGGGTPPSRATAAPGGALVLPSVTAASFSQLPAQAKVVALTPAPDKGVSEPGPQGALPKIGADGRKPWRVYARPFKARPGEARIAIVVTGLGLSQAATRAAIDKMPAAVTLAFDPYAGDLDKWFAEARKAGHETLLSLPLEPADYPISDPGPDALKTNLTAEQNVEKLEYILGLATGYVGVAEMMGSRMVASELAFKPIMEAMSKRGILYLGSRLTRQSRAESLSRKFRMPFAEIDLVIDQEISERAIDAQLTKLAQIARNRYFAVAAAEAYPLTLRRLAAWMSGLSAKKLALAPVSAVAK